MGIAAIIANAVEGLKAAGYGEADVRLPIEEQSDAGRDRLFQVVAPEAIEVFPRLGVSDNIRRATLVVKTSYFRGGGDAGGGDRAAINARAADDMLAMARALEDEAGYDSQNTGIQRRLFGGFRESVDARRTSTWELRMNVDWEQGEDPRAVAA
jgi:hypothetical protein